ncbi:MAG: phosphatidylserine decarboxylase family protein [Bacteroidia bacterium]|nr:phosphatidylserine decarboxylase family protein [Bacteroidia bacterium]
MTIHKEGYPSIFIATVFVAILITAVTYWAPEVKWLNYLALAVSIFVMVVVLQFFRHPNKEIIIDENSLLAPADGKVVVIEETVEDEYLKDKRIQVSIFMSPINVHVNRYPLSGVIKYLKYHPGKYLVAWHPKSSTENERTTIVVENAKGEKFLFRQIAGALARRIVWYGKEGQSVRQGSELGFIKFGSRVDIYLPLSAKVTVNLEEKVVGGKTVIAKLG